MDITLHAGPMKTGSTALQRTIEFAQPLLAEHGLLAKRSWIADAIVRAGCEAEQAEWLRALVQEAEERRCGRILISNEFFPSFSDVGRLSWIKDLQAAGHSVRAVLVRRPLAELYPSLYLQNLKGPAKRTTSFRRFVEEQRVLDESQCWRQDGTAFNYHCLRERLERAGASVTEVAYSRTSLVEDVLRTIWPELPFDVSSLHPPSEWTEAWRARLRAQGLVDNSRSLSFHLAPIAIEVNQLCLQGVLSDMQRNRLMVSLLDASSGTTEVPAEERPLLGEIAEFEAHLHAAAHSLSHLPT